MSDSLYCRLEKSTQYEETVQHSMIACSRMVASKLAERKTRLIQRKPSAIFAKGDLLTFQTLVCQIISIDLVVYFM